MGPSAGAQIGLMLAAVENRYRGVVLVGAGLSRRTAPALPAASAVNFAPHIFVPKLIVQGTYDEDTPLKTAAEPLVELLSEPKELQVRGRTRAGDGCPPQDYRPLARQASRASQALAHDTCIPSFTPAVDV